MSNQRRSRLMVMSSVVLAVAPKCPICFLAYFGIFGVATSSASAYRVWLPPLTALWLALTVGILAIKRDGRRRFGLVALGLIAGVAVYTGKFVVNDYHLVYAGIAVLVGSVVWSSWLRGSTTARFCSPCEEISVRLDQHPK